MGHFAAVHQAVALQADLLEFFDIASKQFAMAKRAEIILEFWGRIHNI